MTYIPVNLKHVLYGHSFMYLIYVVLKTRSKIYDFLKCLRSCNPLIVLA